MPLREGRAALRAIDGTSLERCPAGRQNPDRSHPPRSGRTHSPRHEPLELSNGSRLSCGATAGGRKRHALRYERPWAQTHASAESRPRQLQALVRRRTRDKPTNDAPTCVRLASIRASRSKLQDLPRGLLPECRLGSRDGWSSAPTHEKLVGAYLEYQHRNSS